jgi:rare lipoprotein A
VSNRHIARRAARTGSARRPRRTTYGSVSGPRPDRVAGWAVALGIFLILVASATSRGATTGGRAAEPTGGAQPGGAVSVDDATSGGSSWTPPGAEMSVRRATWYGPGLYGRKTACGLRLRRFTLGVAHRQLPCGTLVKFNYRGRLLTVPVIDRGPYARGVAWDLTAESARRLGLRRTSTIRSIP